MTKEHDMYNVDSYSEKELLDILDLFHPTDRELEAKILSYIDKYNDSSNKDAVILHRFFVDIYKRFFYLDEDEEENGNRDKSVEGFEGIDDKVTPTTSDQNVQLTSSLTYAKGKLNPILKQTYQRIITIDSQYRDSKNGLSTNFTFNFTETLKDVVSIKLYAVQIPYTWYTISKSYGSNFFYIKGNVPGINNGLHDISINIPAGNYSLTTVNNISNNDNGNSISGAIQSAMLNLQNVYTDISFGNTSLSYNINLCKATLTIDIQNHYNENAYRFEFPDSSNSFFSPATVGEDTNLNRSKYLSCFLGFNSPSYSTCSIYSLRALKQIDDNSSIYAFDNSNNTIQIIQYYTDATNDFIPGVSTIYQTINISFPITDPNNSGYKLTQNAIYNIVNNVIKNDSRLNRPGFTDSSLNFIQVKGQDADGNVFENDGNYYFQWQIKLNRYNGNNIPLYKTVLILPYNETPGTNSIWLGNKSCFVFDKSYNELNNLISETYVYFSNYEISGNTYYYFICNDRNYSVNGINDLSYNLSPSLGYSFNGYISEINNGFTNINQTYYEKNGNTNIFNVKLNNDIVIYPSSQTIAYYGADSKFHMSIDMNKYLYTNNFRIDIRGSFLQNVLKFSTVDLSVSTPLYTDISFVGISTAQSNYKGDLLMIIYPDMKYYDISANSNSYKNGISADISYHIYFPSKTIGYNGITGLEKGINTIFREFSDASFSYPLQNCFISITPTGSKNQVRSILNIEITKKLLQSDYTIHFYDLNHNDYSNSSWAKNLYLDFSYNLSNYNYGSYSDINGNEEINSDFIDLTRGGIFNEFKLTPIDEGVTGAGPLLFKLPLKEYTRIDLFNEINRLFDENPVTKGTVISYIKQNNNLEYTKIRWNINKIYTSLDYKIVFYDLYSFVSCFLGNSSVRNATWDTTLGWIMGFHELTEYPLYSSPFHNGYYYNSINSEVTNNEFSINNNIPYRNSVSLSGDTTVSVNLYNYFMIILDDFNPSHLNDGLVTITSTDNNLSLPSYANRAKYICDPVTKQVINTGITNVASNNLTQNQVYSINQIINTQNTPKSYTNQGVYVSDIFALVPIKTTGYTPGQVYVEFGGTLQAQDRIYFGPVNIHRMSISLLNDRGELVDLNSANWSLQFICEQLYQNNNDIKN